MKTQQARVAFAEHITGFWKAGAEYGKPHGLASLLVPVEFLTTLRPSGRLSLLVHPTAAPAFQALASVLLFHDYAIREWASGTLAWRNITGASRARIDEQVRTQRPLATSLHAHGVAVDLNPSVNPYGSTRTDMSAEMVTHALGIRTAAGARVFVWGRDFRDPMHWQATAVATRAELEAGIESQTVPGWSRYLSWAGEQEDELTLRKGDRNELVGFYQAALNAWPNRPFQLLAEDDVFGDAMEAAVRAYQAAARVEQTGVISGALAPVLARYHPEISGGAPHSHAGTAAVTVS